MKQIEAVRIIKALASGIDPQTGVEIPLNSPYRHIKTMRALHVAVRLLEEPHTGYTPGELTLIAPLPVQRNTHEKEQPLMANAPWTLQEDQALREDFRRGLSIISIAKKHQRSRGAIGSRLLRLGIGIIGSSDSKNTITDVSALSGVASIPQE